MSIRPSVRPSVRIGFRAFAGERMERMAWNYACWCAWPPSEPWPQRIRLWSRSVDFFALDATLTSGNGSNLRFPGISLRTHGGNGLKFCMLMYLDYFQNWLNYGHGLLIFFLLVPLWLSETGQICVFRAFPGEHMEAMAWHFACWCSLTTFRTE